MGRNGREGRKISSVRRERIKRKWDEEKDFWKEKKVSKERMKERIGGLLKIKWIKDKQREETKKAEKRNITGKNVGKEQKEQR
jgi:hypothetical protein